MSNGSSQDAVRREGPQPRAPIEPDQAEWQPIATAPKDGTRFLGAWLDADRWGYAVMYWDASFEAGEWDDNTGDIIYRGAWNAGRVGSWGYEEFREETPSHWRPLPKTPHVDDGEAAGPSPLTPRADTLSEPEPDHA